MLSSRQRLTRVGVISAAVASLAVTACKQQAPVSALRENEGQQQPPPADGGLVGDGQMSDPARTLRDKIVGITAPDQIDGLIEEVAAAMKAGNAPADYQFAAATLMPLRALKGIVWRLSDIFEYGNGGKGGLISHSMMLSNVQQTAATFKAAADSPVGEAFYRYVTQPSRGKQRPKFESISQFQDELCGSTEDPSGEKAVTYRDMLLESLKVLDGVSKAPNFRSVWDNRVLFGGKSFENSPERYRVLDKAEVEAAIAGINLGLHSMLLACAYNMDGLPKVVEDLGVAFGFYNEKGRNHDTLNGFPIARRVPVLKAAGDTFHIRGKGGGEIGFYKGYVRKAFEHLQQAVTHASTAYDLVQARRPSDQNVVGGFIGDNGVQAVLTRGSKATIAQAKQLVSGETTIVSLVYGDTPFRVNLKNFYENPPDDLRDLLPIAFDQSPQIMEVKVDGANEPVKYKNYFWGRGVNWDTDTWQRLFPGINGKDVGKASAALTQSWAGGAIAQAMAPVML